MAATIIDRSQCPARRHGRYWMADKLGCRCLDALTERTTRDAAYRRGQLPPGYVNATGTRRRLQALAVEGWSIVRIAELTGLSDRTILVAQGRQPRIQATTARTVATVYQRIAGLGGPSTIAAARARTRGWLDSYHWPDNIIDNPDAQPWFGKDPGDPEAAERRAAVDRLTKAGLSNKDIGERLNLDPRSVGRHRAAIRQAAANQAAA